ncbi:MAG: fibronectin type III domain-containing protein [Acidobacteriota bacterium]
MHDAQIEPRSALRRIPWCLIALASLAGATAAQTFPDPPDGSYEFTSAQSGPWHDPSTWGAGFLSQSPIPDDGDDVLIQDGHVVNIERQESARHRFIRVEGTLNLFGHVDTGLIVETLYVFGDGPGGANEGTLTVGGNGGIAGGGQGYLPGLETEIVFISSGAIDLNWDPKQASRGLVSDGIIGLFGHPKTHMIPAPQDLPAGSSSFYLKPPWGAWDVGDELVIAGTYFQRVEDPAVTSSQDERVTITSKAGDLFGFSPPLAFDHLSVGDRPFHIANLTRHITLRSEVASPVRDRGHVMLRNGDVTIEATAFVDLGRTDKRIPLDDKVIHLIDNNGTVIDYDITTPAPSQIQNRRGRYSLHFHLNGIQPQLSEPPSKVYGSVVDGTVGWGFVNHSSHVDFQQNVAYDFAGAGFVTELGDELGNFIDNIAIRGTGNGEYRQDRLVFENPERPQPLSDFAFSGDGFWFQGPALRVRDNIANGCDGVGMTWFTTGAPDVAQEYTSGPYTHNRYSHFPRSALVDVYGPVIANALLPRYWIHSDTDEKLVLSDLPILELGNFTAYGNLVGFKLRFNNHDNVDWYRENPFDYHFDIVPVCGGSSRRCAIRERQTLDQLTLWNNEQAFRMRYATNTDWQRVDAINRLAYDSLFPTHGQDGAEFRFRIESQTFTDLAIDGYPVAGWIEFDNDDARNEVTFFPDPPAYDNYANRDTQMGGSTPGCFLPSSILVTMIGSDTASLTWQAGANNARYLLRYQPRNTQQWEFLRTTNTFATLTGLSPGTLYDLQIIPGCSDMNGETRVSAFWTPKVAFTTN